MKTDFELLDECPDLTDYKRDLIRRIDVNHETQVSVAKSLGKETSTISLQHKNALDKFTKWVQNQEKKESVLSEEEFDKQVFRMFNKDWSPNKVVEKLGHLERVFELWKRYRGFLEDDYCMALKKIIEYGFEPSKSSKHPLSEQIGRIIGEWYWLAEEKKLILNLLKEKGYGPFTVGLSEDGHGSAYDAVKRVIDHLIKKVQVLESLAHS